MRSSILRSKLGGAEVTGAALLTTALLAAGTSPAVAGASTARPTPRPPVTKIITLTVASSGTTVLATKGEEVKIVLSSPGLRWSSVTVSQSGKVVIPIPLPSGTTPVGVAVAEFKVVGYGQATFTAIGAPACPTTVPLCPTYAVLWHAGVSVPVVDPPPPA